MPSTTVYNFSTSPEDLKIVEATLPLVAQAGTSFTEHFYKILFQSHPELKNLFNQTNQAKGKQPQKLLSTVAVAAQAAIKDGILPGEAIEGICQKHSALHIPKEAYAIVGERLLQTIKDLLTDAQEVLNAWGSLYGDIANAFTTREAEIVQEANDQLGGWTGRRTFVLKEKKEVSSIIQRLSFAPVDGETIPEFVPGQFTTIWVAVEGEGKHGRYTEQPRHYTLAMQVEGEEGCLSISVKKEGLVSSLLHEATIGSQWDLSAPRGCFVMSGVEKLWLTLPDAPIVFLSAGVGITPVLAMLENTVATRSVSWLHSSRNGNVHAYRDRIRGLGSVRQGNLQRRVWYSSPLPEDGKPAFDPRTLATYGEKNEDGDESFIKPIECNTAKYHYKGRMDLSLTSDSSSDISSVLHMDNPNASYFMCGPEGFMDTQKQALIHSGVCVNRIHSEGF